MARMRRKFADVIANQRRGLGSIERNRSPRTTRNISPIGRIVDYEQGKGGRDMSMLPSPIDDRIIETNLMPDTRRKDIKSILDFLKSREDQGEQYQPTLPIFLEIYMDLTVVE
jgi:hypothetical protein